MSLAVPARAQISTHDQPCAGTNFGSTLGCTANDVQVLGGFRVQGGGSITCVAGQDIVVDLEATIVSGMADRYDIAMFVGETANDPQLVTSGPNNQCTVTTLPTANLPPFTNLDGDVCGDVNPPSGSTANTQEVLFMDDVQIRCNAGPDGRLIIPYVLTWKQSGDNQVCSNPPTSPTQLAPGTVSKCNSADVGTPAVIDGATVQGYVQIDKVTVPAGVAQSFGFTATSSTGQTPSQTAFSMTDATAPIRITIPVNSTGRNLTITETALAGWDLTGLTCTTPSGGSAAGIVTTNTGTRQLSATLTSANPAVHCTFTNTRQTRVRTSKALSPTTDPGLFNLGAGPTGSQTIATNQGNGGTTGYVVVTPNAAVTFSEVAGTGTSLANYASTYTCVNDTTGATLVAPTAGTSVALNAPANADVTCTFTNTRRSGTVTLGKSWVNGTTGDAVSLAITGTAAPGNGTSTAPSTTTPASALGYAGDTITVAEAFTTGSAANYTSTLACTRTSAPLTPVVTAGTGLSRTFTMPTDSGVACVWTNSGPSADVSITKSAPTGGAFAGQAVSWTLTVANLGPATATNVQVSDTPTNVSGLALSSATPGCSGASCTFASLASGSSITITASGTVTAAGAFNNVASVTANTFDPITANNSDSTGNNGTAGPSAALSISKTNGGTSVNAGATTQYTIRVANAGPSTATGALLSDPASAGLTVTAVACSPTPGACTAGSTPTVAELQAGNYALPAIASGGFYEIVITATVGTQASVSNTATIAPPAGTNDPTPGDNSATDSDTVNPVTDVAVAKTQRAGTSGSFQSTPLTVSQGDVVQYQLVVTNNGPSAATGATFADNVPANFGSLSVVSATAGGGATTCAANFTGNALSGTFAGPSGATCTVILQGTANGAAASPGVTNTATTSVSSDPTPGSSSVSTIIGPSANLAITKTDSVASVTSGGSTTYTVRVTNNGPSAVTGAVVRDPAVPGLVKTATACTAGNTCVTAPTISALEDPAGFTLPALASGAFFEFTIAADVTAANGASVSNTATVQAPAGVNDPVPGNNSATDANNVVALADLTVSKAQRAGTAGAFATTLLTVAQGELVQYRIVITNDGPSVATGATYSDTVPSNFTGVAFVSASGAGGATACTGSVAGNTLSGSFSGPVGATCTVIVQGTATTTAASPGVTNTVTTSLAADPTPASSAVNTIITPTANLSVVKNNGTASVTAGGSTVYVVRVDNAGPSAATGAVLRDPAATGLSKTSVTCTGTAGNTCVANPSIAALEAAGGVALPAIPAGGFYEIAITASVTATGGSVTNAATITAPPGVTDPFGGDDSAGDTDPVTPSADLSIDKSVDDASPTVGDTVVFTLTVTNSGPSDATGVSVLDLLPSGYAYVSDNGGGAYVPGTGLWTIGALADDATATLAITATVNASGNYANTATVSGNQGDPDGGDNSDTQSTTPGASADLSLAKNVSDPTPAVGDTITFTLVVSNAGPSAATGVVVTDLLPSGYTYVSDTGGGDYVPGTGMWTVGSVAAGGSESLDIVVTVRNTGSYGNTAQITASGITDPDSMPGDDSGDDFATNTPAVDDAPNAVADGATVAVGGSVEIAVLANDSFGVNGPATGAIAITTAPATGSATVDTQGTPNDPSDDRIDFTAPAGFAGPVTFVYEICDADGDCDTATVTVVVGPDANNDSASTAQNTPVSGNVGSNDFAGTAPVFTLLTPPATGTLSFNADGTYTFTPATDDTGTVTFTYRVCLAAPNGTQCDTATVTITVSSSSIDAVDDSATTPFDTNVTTVVGANDTATNGTVGAITADTDGAGGTVTCSGSGATASCTYNPSATFAGVDSYTYTICLAAPNAAICDTATVSVVVGPNAVNDAVPATQNTPVSGNVGGNDFAGLNPTFSIDTLPATGTLMLNPDGTFTYTPATGATGDVTFSYEVCLAAPNDNLCDIATVTISIAAATINAVDDNTTTGFDTNVTTFVGANDTATNGTVGAISSNTQGGNGAVACGGSGATASCTYNPDATFAGVDSYTYTICLAAPNASICDTATVNVVVGPNAVNDAVPATQNTPVSGNVGGNDFAGTNPTFSIETLPATGTLVLNPDGSFTYTPATGATGDVTFSYEVCLAAPNDNLCDIATVTISIAAASVAATDDSATTAFDTNVTTTVGANDTATNGTLGAVAVATQPANGAVTCSGSGAAASCTYNPDANFAGPDSYTYEICLAAPNDGICDTATVNVVVGPNAIDDSVAATQNTPVSGNVGSNDFAGLAPAFTLVSPPATGTLNLNADGTFTYTPAAGATGDVTFTYRVCLAAPNDAQCDVATVTISIAAASIDAVNDSATTPNNTNVTTTVGANDTATNGTVGAITADTDGAGGSVTCSGSGATASCTYDPNPNFAGLDSYTYTICLAAPNASICDTATVSVVVGPNAQDDTTSTTQNTPVSGSVGGNDFAGVAPVFTVFTPPATGTLVLDPDGSFTYTPATGATGDVSFVYQVCLAAPNGGQCDTATMTITIGAASIDAVGDNDTTPFDTNVTTFVGANDTAVNGTVGAITSNTQGGNGAVACGGSGATASCTYNPAANFAGVDAYTYTICLAAPNETICDTAIVNVVVGPNAVDDSASTAQNTPVSGNVGGNDVAGPAPVFTLLTPPATGNLAFGADGSYTFTPAAGSTAPVSFTYQVCLAAPNGTLCDTATVNITVAAASIDAVADSATTPNNTNVTTTVGANDTATNGTVGAITADTDGAGGTVTCSGSGATASCTYDPNPNFAGLDSYTYTICLAAPNASICDTATVSVVVGPNAQDDTTSTTQNTPVSGSVGGNDFAGLDPVFTLLTPPATGTLSFNADGTYTFTPATDDTGTVTFTYRVCLAAPNGTQCDTAMVTITVSSSSIDAVDDSATTPFDTNVTTVVGANDTATNGTVGAITADTDGAGGTVTCSGSGATASCSYNPSATFAGVDSYTYTICLAAPNAAICDTATVSVVVGPNAQDDSASTTQNTPVSGNVGGNDVAGPAPVFTLVTPPATGTLVLNPDGSFTFTPAADSTAPVSFVYQVCLAVPNGGQCDTGQVSITVSGASLDAVDDSAVTANDTNVTTVVGGNDTAGNGTLGAITASTNGSNGTVACSGTGVTASCTYNPISGFAGLDSYTYTICLAAPNAGTCDTATVNVVVGPAANDDSATTTANTAVSGSVATNDVLAAGSTFTLMVGPGNGTLVLNPDGSYTYTPTSGFTGTDTFTYRVCLAAPSQNVCDTALVTITVSAATLVANDDAAGTPADTNVVTVVAANDVAGNGTLGAITGSTDGANGSVTCSGTGATASCTYDPAAVFAGTDSYTYTICLAAPNAGVCDTATVNVVVGPAANDDNATTTQNTPVSGNVTVNDVVGVGSSIVLVTPAGSGSVVLNPDGSYTYTPTAGFTGSDSFTYRICLAAPNTQVCDTAIVSITVNAVGVDAVNDAATTANDTNVTTVVGANDTASNGSLGAISANTQGANGAVACSGTGATASCTYNPAAGFAGVDSYTYTICLAAPNASSCDTATVTVVVAPAANDDATTTAQNTAVSGNVAGNDVAGSGSVYSMVTGPANGSLTLNPDGSYTYTPIAGFTGNDGFTYRLCLAAPNQNVCDTAVVSIAVTDDAPIAIDDTATTSEDTPVSGIVAINDTSSDDGGNVWTLVGANGGATRGTVTMSATGSYTYTPAANVSGSDTFTYQVCDADGDCDTATVTVTITPVDEAPVANDNVASTAQNTPVTGNAATNDVPSNDGGNAWSLVGPNGGALHGTVAMNPDGSYTYTPATGYSGTDVFTYQLCDADGDCDTATVTVTIAAGPASADLSITKLADTLIPTTGGPIVFTIAVTNGGPSPVADAVVTDLLPSGYTYVSSTTSQGVYVAGSGTWAVGALANGAVATLTVNATVNANGNYANTATVTSSIPDPDPADNIATETPTPVQGAPAPSADLMVLKTGPARINRGDLLDFTIVLENRGPNTATNTRLVDPTPTGLQFISASGVCVGGFPCLVGDLPSGAARTVTARYQVPNNYEGPDMIVNTVVVSSDTVDPTPGDSSSSSSVVVLQGQQLSPTTPVLVPVDARWAMGLMVALMVLFAGRGLRLQRARK